MEKLKCSCGCIEFLTLLGYVKKVRVEVSIDDDGEEKLLINEELEERPEGLDEESYGERSYFCVGCDKVYCEQQGVFKEQSNSVRDWLEEGF